ncbi:hypothetical protein BD408DRAFT_415036 [Parasitella parasitica]|nr:hypothetical protein BD408DRAFT_415036 [Parasitella parasitica]
MLLTLSSSFLVVNQHPLPPNLIDKSMRTNTGGVSQHIMGRRIDLLLKGHLSDDKDKQQIIEMAATEIKPAGVCLETEVIQLNKNVRVNKSILGCLRSHCGEYADDSLFKIGMDVIGNVSRRKKI